MNPFFYIFFTVFLLAVFVSAGIGIVLPERWALLSDSDRKVYLYVFVSSLTLAMISGAGLLLML